MPQTGDGLLEPGPTVVAYSTLFRPVALMGRCHGLRLPLDHAFITKMIDLGGTVPKLGEDRASVLSEVAEWQGPAGGVGESKHGCEPPVCAAQAWVRHRCHHVNGERLRVLVEERKVRHGVGHNAPDAGSE